MSEKNKPFVQEYFAAISGKEKTADVVNKYVSDKNKELKEHIAMFETAFPKYELIADDLVVEGDKVAVRATFRGTHKGDLMGIASTGKKVTISLMLIYRIVGDKIVEHWMVADQFGMMQQLGVIPAAN